MIVFYDDATGRVEFTIMGEKVPANLASKSHVIVSDEIEIRVFEAWRVVGGVLSLVDLAPARSQAKERVNQLCGEVRTALITDIPGQEMIYLAKEKEAQAYMADPAPDLANYRLLSREVGLTAPDAYSLAQVWLNMSDLWYQAASDLENARLATAQMIDNASTISEIDMIVAGFAQAMNLAKENLPV